ncbi:MAG: hypothetical protein ACRC35_02725 [Angustibacter sp.]
MLQLGVWRLPGLLGGAKAVCGPGCVDEAGEGLAEGVCDGSGSAVGAVEVEPREDRLVEQLACVVGGAVVEVAGAVEDLEGSGQYGAAGLEVIDGLLELSGDARLAFADGLQPCLDLVLRPVRVTDEVEESILLGIEFRELLAQFRAEFCGRCFRVGDRRCGKSFERLPVTSRNADVRVVVDHGALDLRDGQGG